MTQPQTPTQRAKEIMAGINAAYKSNVVTMASDPKHVVEYLPTGLLPIDILMPGGLPRGRMIEMYGGPSSLKSYVLLCAIAQTQLNGGICALLDTEHTFDPAWAESIGVDIDALILPDVPTGERAFDIAQSLIANGVDLLGFDSIAAAQPQTYNENPLEDSKIQPGRQAALFSLGLRKVTAVNKNTAIMFTNQTRTSIGITFGNPENTPGGKAPEYYSSLRLRMASAGKVTVPAKAWDGEKWVDSKIQTAQKYRAEMTKSKLSRPFGTINFVWDLEGGGRIDMPKFLIAQGLENGLIEVKGNTWRYSDFQVVGRAKFETALSEDFEIMEELECAIRTKHGLAQVATTTITGAPVATQPSSSPTKRKVLRQQVDAGKVASSSVLVRKRTPAAGQAKSPSTVLRRKKSSK